MITLFSLPKPFQGPFELLQRNAIESWHRLDESVQVILYGDEQGVEDAARDSGAEHVNDVDRNEYGTPLLPGVFDDVRARARNHVLCFVNTDIILLSDFADAVRAVAAEDSSFLMIGESWDTRVDRQLPSDPGWEDTVRALPGRKRGAGAIDYFVFTHDLFHNIPPFAVGRVAFDNWLVWNAAAAGAMVVDATRAVRAVHQQHDYSHVAGGFADTRLSSLEGRRNYELTGGKRHIYTRFDATHLLTPRGLRRSFGRVFRAKERARKAIYKSRRLTPWPPT